MADEYWVTPAEAERLVASYQGFGGILLHEAKAQLFSWIAQGQLATMAREVTRWEDEPPAPTPPPSPPVEADNDPSDRPLSAMRVNPLYRPMGSWELPLVKSQMTAYSLTLQDWNDALADAAGADIGTIFSSSELTHRLIRQRHPNARITYAGLRFWKADIEQRIELAGWQSPKSEETNAGPAEAQPIAREAGRRPANWWPHFAEELAVYIHEAGVPDGSGQEGQSAMIDELCRRMSVRGKEEPARTTVQPVVRAILARLRSAEN